VAPKILIVIPTYGQFDYAIRAVRTALSSTRTLDPYVTVIDDASPERLSRERHKLPHSVDEPYGNFLVNLRYAKEEFGDKIYQLTFDENGGLTRSWNAGLNIARQMEFDFCCVTNSDVMFAHGWDGRLFDLLNSEKYDLVGPLTNAPGTEQTQYVGDYSVLYRKDKKDDLTHMDEVQNELYHQQGARHKAATLNGFCMVAFTRKWWANAYDDSHVFCPRNDFNSKGERNPTPLMTLNEYEFQRRLHAKGGKSGVCLGSYVYHYRAVSRGDKHKRGDWARIEQGTA
jgi:glycosyltransferase involved in cell wall biosynthesis